MSRAFEDELVLNVNLALHMAGHIGVSGVDLAFYGPALSNDGFSLHLEATKDTTARPDVAFSTERTFEDGTFANEIDLIWSSMFVLGHG